MKLHFLEATVPLTKTFEQTKSGLVKSPYPNAYEVTSHTEQVSNLRDFEAALKRHAALKHCLLKGLLTRDLVKESRAGTTRADEATEWICLDIDGLQDTKISDVNETRQRITVTVEHVLAELGLGDVSYVLQWSSSYGIENTFLRCHAFMLLAKPVSALILKQWLINLNHKSTLLRDGMTLTKTGNSLSWRLDVSTCQNDKLIYITPPVLKGGLVDPMGKQPRITLVKKPKDKIQSVPVISMSVNRQLTDTRINELRVAAGMGKKKISYKTHGSTQIVSNPDTCTVTDRKTERGFVYLNLNGGDSWGYYHPESNPEFIYNFKDEPVYLTKELLPEYWASLQESVNTPDSAGLIRLAFLDVNSDTYYRGTYDTPTDTLDINPTKSVKVLRDHCKTNGIPLPEDVVPEWHLVFDPQDNVRVDPDNKTINVFTPSPYMRAQARQVTQVPKTVKKVITHMIGGDPEAFDRFMNWLAYVLQVRDVALTGWIFHGRTGTGKGTFLNKILRPIFGANHVAMPRLQDLSSDFNTFIERSLIVAVDEADADAFVNERGVMADLRRYMTEKEVPIRQMYRQSRIIRNYSCWLFFSNAATPVRVPREDRRFNVGKYQTEKLQITDAELAQIEKELQAFHNYLLYYTVDKDLVFSPLENADREELIDLSENSVDMVVDAIRRGDMTFFIDQLPTDNRWMNNQLSIGKVEDYKAVLKDWFDRTDTKSGHCNLARDELRAVFEYCVGKIPDTPNKFTAYLGHHRMRLVDLRVDGNKSKGWYGKWTNVNEWPKLRAALNPTQKVPLKRVK